MSAFVETAVDDYAVAWPKGVGFGACRQPDLAVDPPAFAGPVLDFRAAILEAKGLLKCANQLRPWDPLPAAKPTKHDLERIRESRIRKLRIWSWSDWASLASLLVVVLLTLSLPTLVLLQRRVLVRQETELADVRDSLGATEETVSLLRNVALEYYQGRHRPVEPGISIGHVGSTAGTICCLVRSKEGGGRVFLLGGATTLNPPGGAIGDAILQPGPVDGGTSADVVAHLSRFFPLNSNVTTAEPPSAIAELALGTAARQAIPGFGPIRGVAPHLEIGQEVVIVGRTSGIARARVEGTGGSVDVGFRGTSVRLSDVTVLVSVVGQRATRGGDDGAPVLTPDGRLAALVIAGGPNASIAIPIQRVLDAFDVELVGPERQPESGRAMPRLQP